MGKVDQGFIVLWMAKHFWKGELSYLGYGSTGKQVRDVLHVHDLFRLLDWQMHHISSVNGNIFNVGGGLSSSVSLFELTELCSSITGNSIPIHPITENRKADIHIYITDNSKVFNYTVWSPQCTIENALQDVFEWLSQN